MSKYESIAYFYTAVTVVCTALTGAVVYVLHH